jgi:dienelactone hydrolase
MTRLTRLDRFLVLGLICAVSLVAGLGISFIAFNPTVLPFVSDKLDRPSIDEVSCEPVTYQAQDGVQISASWCYPSGEEKAAVAILLHEENGSRAQWNPLIPILVKEKYAVLAPDLRGHGESNKIIKNGVEEPYQLTNRQDALLDVDTALTWVKQRDDVDKDRIGIIGARLGADLAYVSSGLFTGLRAGVAITPDPYKPDDPLLTTIQDFAAHDVFIMAGGRRQWEEAVSLGIRINFPKGRRYLETPDLDGVALLANDEMIRDTLQFFKERVASPPPPETPSPAPVPTETAAAPASP